MASGYPGTFAGGLTTGYLNIGAVQNTRSNTFGYPGTFAAGLTTGYLNIGAVEKNVSSGGKLFLGSTQIKQLYLGSTQIKKAYLGSTVVYSD